MKKTLFVLTVFLGLAAVGLITWFVLGGPVLVEWHYGIRFGAICDPPVVILNPLRNRETEKIADNFLGEIKKGNLGVLDQAVFDPERREHFGLRERELKIVSWYSGSRNENNDEADINYWIERKYHGGCHVVPANVGLTKVETTWRVTKFNPIY